MAERRARLAVRHHLSPAHRAAGVLDATDGVVCLHATDPATVYLSAWARVEGLQRDDVDRALYIDRTLVKHLAMRRTLFVAASGAPAGGAGGGQPAGGRPGGAPPGQGRRAAPAWPPTAPGG